MEKGKLYGEIIDIIGSGVYFVDVNKSVTFWNKAAENISGYKKNEILGLKCENTRLDHIDEHGNLLCKVGCPLYATIIDGNARKAEVFLRHKEGYRVPVKVEIFPIEEDGEIIGAVEVFHQNSPAVYDDNLIEDLKNNAASDPLTGIPNRKSVEVFLEFKVSEVKRFQRKFCVVFLDIDNFGEFNKKFGHAIGDAVLKSVASTVTRVVRQVDLFGRWGGEEFVGIFEIKQEFETSLLAEKIRMLIANSDVGIAKAELQNLGYEMETDEEMPDLSVTASIGCTVIRDTDDMMSVISRADEMMRESKKKGKNKVSFSN